MPSLKPTRHNTMSAAPLSPTRPIMFCCRLPKHRAGWPCCAQPLTTLTPAPTAAAGRLSCRRCCLRCSQRQRSTASAASCTGELACCAFFLASTHCCCGLVSLTVYRQFCLLARLVTTRMIMVGGYVASVALCTGKATCAPDPIFFRHLAGPIHVQV
jgi:hypothetical protein